MGCANGMARVPVQPLDVATGTAAAADETFWVRASK